MYQEGIGVVQDYSTAVKWYKLAAARGSLVCQFNLGVMHLEGLGVTPDKISALMWFNIATTFGDDGAKENGEFVREQMTKLEIYQAQKLTDEWVEEHFE